VQVNVACLFLAVLNISTFQVAGPSGCGKTQFCMMMSVLATQTISQGGLDGGVVYIDTESALSAER
jgi:RAD51-like protein 1